MKYVVIEQCGIQISGVEVYTDLALANAHVDRCITEHNCWGQHEIEELKAEIKGTLRLHGNAHFSIQLVEREEVRPPSFDEPPKQPRAIARR